jgi:hypothetical protein
VLEQIILSEVVEEEVELADAHLLQILKWEKLGEIMEEEVEVEVEVIIMMVRMADQEKMGLLL